MSTDEAHRFTEGLAGRLGITADHVLPAFEDPAERMLKEGALPPNVDPADPKIDDPVERARIMREFERHLSAPTGYVLPVQRWGAQASGGWISEIWQTRRRRLFLVPGDSPIGFRLPLSSLPYIKPIDEPHLVPADPFADRGALPDPAAMARAFEGARQDQAGGRAGACAEVADLAKRARQEASARSAQIHSGAHRARGRAARRPALRVHAAGREARGLSRASRRRRGDRRRAQAADPYRRLSAAARSAAERDQGHARSRRHRGQHPSGHILARSGRHHAHRLRGGPSVAGSAPTSS